MRIAFSQTHLGEKRAYYTQSFLVDYRHVWKSVASIFRGKLSVAALVLPSAAAVSHIACEMKSVKWLRKVSNYNQVCERAC